MGYTVAWVLREAATAEYGTGGVPERAVLAETTSRSLDRWPGGTSAPRDELSRADVIDDLGDEITTLAAHIHAATHRLLVLLARFDRLEGWRPGGHRSCAHWLAFNTGYDLGTARERVRVARALEGLPGTGEAMSRGELSFSKVRAMTRVADASNEADLLELARGVTTQQLEAMVRAWKRTSRKDEAALERERHLSRRLSVFPDDDGMYLIRGRLDPEVGAVLMRAIEAASDALDRETPPPGSDTVREAGRHRADAIGLMAERALAAGFGRRGPERESTRESCGCGDDVASPPISGTRAERYQVVLHVAPETLSADGEPGTSELEDGTRVSAETSRRLACDAGLVNLTRDRNGSVLDVGRRTRTIPPALRRALEARDRGCRFPGCGSGFTEAHHVVHWADGGGTSLENTLLLCRYHHRLVHEEEWTVEWWGTGRPAFRDPRGSAHYGVGRAPGRRGGRPEAVNASAAGLMDENRDLGVEPDTLAPRARWKREADIPDEVLFRALEAAL